MAVEKMDLSKKMLVTHEFRVSFPAVFSPRAFGDQKPRYGLTMLFPKDYDFKAKAEGQANSMFKAFVNAAKEKWGEKEKWPKKLKKPWLDGDEMEGGDLYNYADHWVVRCTANNQPGLIDRNKQPILDESDFYPGCYARAQIVAVAYDQAGNVGVKFVVLNIQKTRDGEAFSGRQAAEDVFSAIESDEDEENDEDDDDETPPPVKNKKRQGASGGKKSSPVPVVDDDDEDDEESEDEEDDEEEEAPPPSKKKKKKEAPLLNKKKKKAPVEDDEDESF